MAAALRAPAVGKPEKPWFRKQRCPMLSATTSARSSQSAAVSSLPRRDGMDSSAVSGVAGD